MSYCLTWSIHGLGWNDRVYTTHLFGYFVANRRKNVDEFIHGRRHRQHTRNRPAKRYPDGLWNVDLEKGSKTAISREVDLHEMGLHAAKDCVKKEIIDGQKNGERGLKFIHGSHGGTAIQQWMRGGAVSDFLTAKGIEADVWGPDPNITCVSFE